MLRLLPCTCSGKTRRDRRGQRCPLSSLEYILETPAPPQFPAWGRDFVNAIAQQEQPMARLQFDMLACKLRGGIETKGKGRTREPLRSALRHAHLGPGMACRLI